MHFEKCLEIISASAYDMSGHTAANIKALLILTVLCILLSKESHPFRTPATV